jgi:proline-specific peptidase
MAVKEGYFPFHGYRTWYQVVGTMEQPGKLPILCLHGGPGATHDYFEPLEQIALTGRRVIFYDQLGCGNSDVPSDPSTYTLTLYLEEIEAVRRALELENVHLLGHSWGGMLAMEYALRQPTGLASLVLADTTASIPGFMSENRRLIADLPIEVQETILKHEAAGTTDSSEYNEACKIFFRHHGSGRIDPRPDCLNRMANKPGDDVYRVMWGSSEWFVTGTLKDWDITTQLCEINVPTLVLAGRFDHATPFLAEKLYQSIANSEFIIFEKSGYFPHLEETEHYIDVVSRFLDRVESGK